MATGQLPPNCSGDMARMPEMPDNVRRSVARSRRALEHLMWHANRVSAQE